MSAQEQAAAAIVTQIALVADGAVLGLALAYIAVKSFFNFRYTACALRRITKAPLVQIGDLRSLLSSDTESDSSGSGKLVVIRGQVDKASADTIWKGSRPSLLLSIESGENGVILQRTQTCMYNDWKGIFGWTSELRAFFSKSWKQQEILSTRTVPFVLVDSGRWPNTDYVNVNLDGSSHPLPLTSVAHHMLPVSPTPCSVLHAAIGHQYPVGLLDEEKILPLGKNITAVGTCSLKDGTPEIQSCDDLPYFLSDLTKERMIRELARRSNILLWSGIVLGSLSIGILGYATVRNWGKWRIWRDQRQRTSRAQAMSEDVDAYVAEDEDIGEIPDGQLCVICLTRRRRSAFTPCGHLVCCQRCALMVQREMVPKCPVCRQAIRNSVEIYDS